MRWLLCCLMVFIPPAHSGAAAAHTTEAGSSPGASSKEHCDEAYKLCTARCKKLRARKARSICYSICMADYTKCLGSKD